MKKRIWVMMRYYLILFGGFFTFVTAVLIGYIYYADEVQRMFDNYPYILLPVIMMFFIAYLYALKRAVLAKDFQKAQKVVLKQATVNRGLILKKTKIFIIILSIYSTVHLALSIYIVYKVRNGAEINYILDFWSNMVAIPFVILYCAIYRYKKLQEQTQKDGSPE